ncbi:MAG: metallophosphoesterase [Candidatus Nanohaloarchaea archaeon]|nr:metallophosphoesterase [Candidatus Nanohaloarchaea archaeon]
MKTLLLTDIHGDTEKLEEILKREKFEVALVAGDLSDAGEYSNYEKNLEKVLETLDENSELTDAIPGNMDPERECVRQLIDRRMNLHKNISSYKGFEATGFGGGQTPFGTPFEPEEKEIRDVVSKLHERMQSDTKVAVIHQPPANTELDVADGNHVGSSEVRSLIEDSDFDLMVTGHIHESRGTDNVGGTLLTNPGPVKDGYYAVAEIEEGIDLELKHL